MSRRLERLIQFLTIKQEQTKNAYQQLVYAQEQFKKNKLRHDQLLGYRQDYLQQLGTIAEQGTFVDRVRSRVDFISHLDTALSQLSGHLALLAKARSKAEQTYKQAKIAEESVCLLIERVKRGELAKLDRLEQKENDEYAQKQWYSNQIGE